MTDGFESYKVIQEKYEQLRNFNAEDPSSSVARFEWLVTRHRAVSLISAREIGLDPTSSALLMAVQTSMLFNFRDFLYIGVGIEDEIVQHHPMKQVVDDLIKAGYEPDNLADLSRLISPILDSLERIEQMADEDIIHILQTFKSSETE